jgi:uncharacterized membrane protein YkoI
MALLVIGPVHSKDKDKKKKQREAEAAQVERQAQPERVVRVENPDEGYSPGETPQLAGKKSKSAAPVQNIREPVRAEAFASVSIDRVIEQVERRYKAKVVRADKKTRGDKQIYELRLLSDDGNVKIVRVDAETGREI